MNAAQGPSEAESGHRRLALVWMRMLERQEPERIGTRTNGARGRWRGGGLARLLAHWRWRDSDPKSELRRVVEVQAARAIFS